MKILKKYIKKDAKTKLKKNTLMNNIAVLYGEGNTNCFTACK